MATQCVFAPAPLQTNFTVQLRAVIQGKETKQVETEDAVKKLKFQPQSSRYCSSGGHIAGTLYYEQWSEALEAVVQLWEMKLDDHNLGFWPWIIFGVQVTSEKLELNDRLKLLFVKKLEDLKNGDLVDKWLRKLSSVEHEIKRVSAELRRTQKLRVSDELLSRWKDLLGEMGLVRNRLDEFTSALNSLINCLENGEGNSEEGAVHIFRLKDEEIYWWRIYKLMRRECRRLEDGLPIYGHRREILKQIYSQQVTILIGETGSGKSTQLVQFLADSGFSNHGAIVCTQPRKLAAISLAERVREESCGCHDNTSVAFYPAYSSVQELDSKVTFMTDNCLLHHCMNDENLSRFSCIIIDEAHERSLNTDLLLALIKNVLIKRPCLRLIIMSATVDADQFTNYFFGSRTLHVPGRNFPVDIIYEPCEFEKSPDSKLMPSYFHDVLRMVTKINSSDGEGTILAFLTSQIEVELACEKFQASSAIALPLHGKLSYEDQCQTFRTYPGKRKIIFVTNIAETSLTIPGVKYVVDTGMVKESRFEPDTGMNVLRVCRVSQSSANQRAGRAGRTGPGVCYRLYQKNDFESMQPHMEPEIRRSNLSVAVLKILALGVKDVQKFDFVDAPSVKAIEMAVTSLVQIGAIVVKEDGHYLTPEGRKLVKLGIEPRRGKMILQCIQRRLGKEGLVLAAVMANSRSIFCRVGKEVDKLKSDCLKVQFCHSNGDLFTLLAVYKEWESVPQKKKKAWCWENSINAKTMRRCQDTVVEIEACLKNELNIIVPNLWYWNPQIRTEHDKNLKNIILDVLADNVAMYSGLDALGYEVASTRKHFQLHPSCSLLNFGQRPNWVVFEQILSTSNEYLVCVTACDFEYLSILSPPRFDFLSMDSQRLQKMILSGFGSFLLKMFSGKSNCNVRRLVASIRATCADQRIRVEVNFDQNVVLVHATSRDMEKVCGLVDEELKHQKKLLQNECVEKCLYSGGPEVLPSIALFGAGAEIKHLELENRYINVDIYHSDVNTFGDRELLEYLEEKTAGRVCAIAICKSIRLGPDSENMYKWGRVTFLTPDAANKAVQLPESFCSGILKVVPSRNLDADNYRLQPVTANILWPRRYSRGIAVVKCDPKEVASLVDDLSNLKIGDRSVWCKADAKFVDSVVITGLDKNLSEHEIYQEVSAVTNTQIRQLFLRRSNAIIDPPLKACEEAIQQVVSPFMPRGRGNMQGVLFRVEVSQPKPMDNFTRALITFDGNLHLEVAKALEQIDAKVLPGCRPWQKVECHRLFYSYVCCPAPVYYLIRNELNSLITHLQRRNGVECRLNRNPNGSYQVKISASATKIVAELRKPLEQLMQGHTVRDSKITPAVLQILYSRDGALLMRNTQQDTGTHIIFEKHSMVLRVFGSPGNIVLAEQRLVESLLALYNSKQLEVQLCDGVLPADMMKRVIQHFGADLRGLKEMVPEAKFILSTRRHSIYIEGNKEIKQKLEDIILDLAQTTPQTHVDAHCSVCLCELDDPYMLEGCCHKFCRQCLFEQFESAIKNPDSFPLRCTKEGCGSYIVLADLKSLLSVEKLNELFRTSLSAYVASSNGIYRFCPSPDCVSVYRVAERSGPEVPFKCGLCFAETCTWCHMEYHPSWSCEMYQKLKDDPDSSLKEWCHGKENVKACPVCRFTIEKDGGCDHMVCRCGRHVCWLCLEVFGSADDCYTHLRSLHGQTEYF